MTRRLAAAGCIAADHEAAVLVGAAAGDRERLEGMVRRREAGEPFAWIAGGVMFCGRPMAVDQGVFVPRPQTEELARRAATLLPEHGRAVDLCTGSGAVAAHLGVTVAGATVVAVDIDPRAVACARRNGVAAVCGDLGAPLRDASFDVVTAVAPYVPTGSLRLLPADVQRHEPVRALDGGHDGLRVVARLIDDAARLLQPGGSLLLEVGGDQEEAVAALLASAPFVRVAPWHDEVGDLRGVHAVVVG